MAINLKDLSRHILSVYRPMMRSKEFYYLLCGGAAAGKKVACAQKLIKRVMAKPSRRFVVLREERPIDPLKENPQMKLRLRMSWELMKDTIKKLGIAQFWHENNSEMSLVFSPNGSSIHLMRMEDCKKIRSLSGVTGIWIDSATDVKEEDFDQADEFLRGQYSVGYKQILMSFNPVGSRHWIERRFFNDPPADCRVLKTTYRDNPFAGPEYARMLEDLERKNPELAKIYKDGEWGA